MLASPGVGVSAMVSAGCLPRFVPPLRRSVIFGLKPRPVHSASWKREERLATWPRVEVSRPLTAITLQEVPVRVKSGLSRLTSTVRTSSGMPCRIEGIGSETAVISAVLELTWAAIRVTTVPRSKGPAVAGMIVARLSGAPL